RALPQRRWEGKRPSSTVAGGGELCVGAGELAQAALRFLHSLRGDRNVHDQFLPRRELAFVADLIDALEVARRQPEAAAYHGHRVAGLARVGGALAALELRIAVEEFLATDGD